MSSTQQVQQQTAGLGEQDHKNAPQGLHPEEATVLAFLHQEKTMLNHDKR